MVQKALDSTEHILEEVKDMVLLSLVHVAERSGLALCPLRQPYLCTYLSVCDVNLE
jgi:hypothetical protein